MAGGRNSKSQAEIAEKRQKCLELRKCGGSFRFIAEQQGISLGLAHKYIADALSEINGLMAQDAEQLRELELQRLDTATLAIAKLVRQGHLGAVDRWLRISERRSKLLGLDAPIQQQVKLQTEKQLTETLDVLQKRMNPDAFEQLITALTALDDSPEVSE
jgi:hypothetical protein